MTAINLALRNRYGYVIWGNSLGVEQKLIYRTGFNLSGFVRELRLEECPPAVQGVATEAANAPTPPRETEATKTSGSGVETVVEERRPRKQLRLF